MAELTYAPNREPHSISLAKDASGTPADGDILVYVAATGKWTTMAADTATDFNGLTITTSTGTLTIANGSSLITAGAYAVTFTATATTGLTLPTTGTLATLAGAEALTGKTYNGLTITTSTGTLTVAAAKLLTVSNTLTLTGTDASSVAFGAGGTVAYQGGALGAATATSINGLTITTSTGTLTIVNGGSLITAGAHAATFTFTAPTGVTFPTTGTLETTANRTRMFDDDTARNAATPTYLGQPSFTTQGPRFHIGTALSAGGWTLIADLE